MRALDVATKFENLKICERNNNRQFIKSRLIEIKLLIKLFTERACGLLYSTSTQYFVQWAITPIEQIDLETFPLSDVWASP